MIIAYIIQGLRSEHDERVYWTSSGWESTYRPKVYYQRAMAERLVPDRPGKGFIHSVEVQPISMGKPLND